MKCKKKANGGGNKLGSANPEKWMDGQKWAKQFKISSSTRHQPQTQPDTGLESTAARYTRFSITSKRAPTSLTGSLRAAAGAYPFTQPSHGRSNSAPDFQDFGCRTTSCVSAGLWQRCCTVNTFDTFDFSLLFLSQTDSLICFGTRSMEGNVETV